MTILIAILFLSLVGYSQKENSIVQGEILVKFKTDVDGNKFANGNKHINLIPQKRLSKKMNIWLFKHPAKSHIDTVLKSLKNNPNVIIAQPNHYVQQRTTIPNDPNYNNQWALAKIKAINAWDISTGGTTVTNEQIVIAIIDGGFDINHDDINYWKNNNEIPNNGIDDDNNGYIDDFDGWNAYNSNGSFSSSDHGTHVTGIAGAIGNNNKGVSGINWNVQTMPIMGSSGTEDVVIEALGYAYDMRALYNQTNGAQGAFVVVTNGSFGVDKADPDDYPLWCSIYDDLGQEGILSVAATANGSWDADDKGDMPCGCSSNYLIAVTNSDQNDNINSGAAWGKNTIDLIAPGTDIYSTLPSNSYGNMTGTSMASPQVAGAVALLYSAACEEMIINYHDNPSQVALTIKQFLLNNSDPIYNLLLKIGYGRLNVYKSIIKMYTQYETDKYLTGNATASEQHAAINSIVVENYTATGGENIEIVAGQSVTLKPGTHLAPTPGGSIHIYTAKNQFDCSIPIQPLTVELIAPENAYCGGYSPITCNAVPTGGLTPYSYVWYSKVITSSSWVVHNNNSPNIAFLSSEDFYVKVELTDDRGVSVMSQTKFIQCIESKNLSIDPIETQGVPIIDITEQNSIENIDYSTYINQEYLRQTFNIYPNPANNICNISFSLESEQQITITISDIKGNLVNKVIDDKKIKAGEHLFEYNISNFPVGVYLFTISSKDGFNAMKFIKTY